MIELVKNASKVKLLMVQREFMIQETISAGETIGKSCSALIDGQTWCNNDSSHFQSFLQIIQTIHFTAVEGYLRCRR